MYDNLTLPGDLRVLYASKSEEPLKSYILPPDLDVLFASKSVTYLFLLTGKDGTQKTSEASEAPRA